MSLLSITMINEILSIERDVQSGKIVSKLHEKIIHSLQNNKADGLEIALCVLDREKGQIQFTGAMNHLVHIRKRKLRVIKADSYSINSMEEIRAFSQNNIQYQKGDVIYLFTDGYKDQFGGERDKKYSIKRFYSTLLEICELPMLQQKAVLEKKLSEWMMDNIQTDDITVMGVRL